MITTDKGYQYAEEADTVTSFPAVTENNALLHEARPGVSVLTTTVRNALSGDDLWDGRIIWNTTTLCLEKYDLGTTSWVVAASIVVAATTVDGPDAFGDASAVGDSLDYARKNHKHGLPSVSSLATAAALAAETARAEAEEATLLADIGTEVTAREAGDAACVQGLNGVIQSVIEPVDIVGAALGATAEIDVTTNSTLLFVTANAANNWAFNIRSTSGATLNSLLAIGQSITVTVLVTQGATPYYCTAIEVDGGAQTVHWQGGNAPAAGFASGIDVYTINIIKTANATFTVLASLTQF